MTAEGYRPRCYLDIEIDQEPVGRIIIELYADVCPLTCANFRSLCCGDKGYGKATKKPLNYKGTLFHRVIKNFVIQSGDFESGNGTGGESIYGGQFNDENFIIKHEKPFLMSMANKGRNTNGSQFFILTQPSPHLDGKHVVFGEVISGFDVVAEIENLKTDANSRPIKEVKIGQCGELVLKSDKKRQRKKSSSDSSSEDEDEDKKKKKKKKKHSKKHKKEKKISKNRSGIKDEEDVPCSVDPEEIPAIPANNFLMRRTSPAAEFRRAPRVRESYNYKRRPPSRSRSGRKIKGRGNMRYRTPDSSERSGSETPPHWKQAQSRLKNIKDVIPLKNKDKDNHPSDEMSVDDDHDDGNARNPFLHSRLGMVFKNSTNFRKDRDARLSIDENRRRWSPEESAHCSYRDPDKKADLFKQLFEDDARHGNQWFQEHSPEKRNDNHTSPLRSKIVVKSNAASRNSRERESRNVERLYRVHEENNRGRSSFTDRRSRNFRFDASSSEQGNFYRSDDKHQAIENKKEKKKNSDVTKCEKKEISHKAQKRFSLLENDLFRYTKHEQPKSKRKEKTETEKPRSDVAVNDCLPQENVLNNMHLDSFSTVENSHNVKSPEKLEVIKSNNTTPAVSESPKLEESYESVVSKDENIIVELSVLKNDNESDFHSEEPNQNNVSLLQNIVEYTTEKDSDNENINDSCNSDYNQSDHLSIPVPEEPPATSYDSNRKINSPTLVEPNIIEDESSDMLQKQSLPDIIPLPDEKMKAIELEEKPLEVKSGEDMENSSRTEKFDVKQDDGNNPTPVSPHHNKHGSREKSSSPSSSEHNLNLKPRPLVPRSPSREPPTSAPKNRGRSKSPAHHSTRKKQASKSPSDRYKSSPSKRSRSPVVRRSRSPSHKNKSPVSRRNRTSSNSRRSRSRSVHRSTSKNRGHRRHSRSPVARQRRSRSPPRNSGRGSRSFRYSGGRNRSPDRRGAFQRRYGKSPVYRGPARGRSASRRSDSRSRSRSVDKRRRRRRESTSSSSSSSSSSRSETAKKRNAKNKAKRGKKRSSSSSTSSRSKRSNSDST